MSRKKPIVAITDLELVEKPTTTPPTNTSTIDTSETGLIGSAYGFIFSVFPLSTIFISLVLFRRRKKN